MFIIKIVFYTLLWIAYVILFAVLESLKSIYEFTHWLIQSIKEDIEIERELKRK